MTSLKNLWQLRHSTLTNNIVFLLIVFGITPLAILFLLFQFVFISHEKENVERFQRETALRIADHVSSDMNRSMIQIQGLSEMVAMAGLNQNLFWKLNEFLSQNPGYDQVTILDSQGREVYKAAQEYTFQSHELEDRSAAPEIQHALTGKPFLSLAKFPLGGPLRGIMLILPIRDTQANIAGALEVSMNLRFLWAIIADHMKEADGFAYIISPDGHIIAGQEFSVQPLNQELMSLPIVQAFLTGQTGVWNYRSFQDQQVIGASALVPDTGWGVIVETPSAAAYGRIHRIAIFFLGLYAVTLIAAVILGLIFSQNRIIGPVKALQQEIESLSQGVFPHGLQVKGSDEIGQLSQAFNQMVQHIKNTTVSRDLLAQEVAERKQVEEALLCQEATLRSIFLTVPLGIGSLNQWILVGGNDFFYRMTGYTKEELWGQNFSQLFGHKNDFHKIVEQIRQTLRKNEETVTIETHWRQQDGQLREIFLKFAAIDKNDPETDLVFAAMDISDLKKMEKERLKIDKLESLGIMAGGLAHDFNNFLTIIQGNIELVGLEMKKPGKTLERLLEAEQACQQAQHLAKQFLLFAKGGMPNKKSVTVSELLQDVVPLALSGSNSKIEIFIDENLYPIEIDKDQFHQVVNNILLNADQAMPRGGLITIKANNQYVTDANSLPLPEGNYVKLSFIDQGTGIDEKDLRKIFDPYFTTKQFGNGLGLTSAFSMIKNHQGHIAVDSKLGQGSSFHLYLPVAQMAPRITDTKVSTMPIRGEGRILVMDDEPAIRTVLAQMLQKLGYESVCVEDGGQVLVTYQQSKKDNKPFDAVILDLTIPGGLGAKETMALLLQLDPRAQAIVSSGYGNDPIMANYEQYGFKGVIAKPYKVLELSLVLDNFLSKNKTSPRKKIIKSKTAVHSDSL